MNKLHGRRTALLMCTLPAFFSGKARSLGALRHRRQLPPRPLLHPTRAALSTFPSSSAPTAASVALASHQEPIPTTVSRCTPQKVVGRHVFEVAGYSLAKGIGDGKFIQSGTFSVGGYDWRLKYYPDGNYDDYTREIEDGERHNRNEEDDSPDRGYIAVFLELMSKDAEVMALCGLRIVNPATGLSPAACSSMKRPRVFNDTNSTWGFGRFKVREELSKYLRDDCLRIQCDITIVTGMPVSQSEPMSSDSMQVPLPPSNLTRKT